MYIYNNNSFSSITEIKEKFALISREEILKIFRCNKNGFEKIIKDNNISSQEVRLEPSKRIFLLYKNSDFENLENYKKERFKNDYIPIDYKSKQEFCEILGIKSVTLNNIVYWCWDFKKYSRYFFTNNVKKLYYLVTPETLKFYQEKMEKYFNPKREHNIQKIKNIEHNIADSLIRFEQQKTKNFKHHKIKIDKLTLSYMLDTDSVYFKKLVEVYKCYSMKTIADVSIMELHHIVPRFYARNGAYYPKLNNLENLIYLPPNIHFLVHFLEYKCALKTFKDKFFGACCIKVASLNSENIEEKYINEITDIFIKTFFI